jgi:tetratricopeptide (TPR) repeat protein
MLANAPPQVSRVETADPAEIEAAVAAWMAKHGQALSDAKGAEKKDPQAAARAKEQAIADAFAALTDPATSDAEREKLWKELAKAGLIDALVAEFEKRAELDPDDADKQVDLGSAYLQKLFTVGDMEKGLWATRADKAFDSALVVDDHHWEARFSKAVSLSFWPPLFGKQKESIKNFEVLVAQQSALPSDARYAQTHLWLGNLYQQTGQHEQAVAAWRAGLELFPDNEALKKQLEQ